MSTPFVTLAGAPLEVIEDLFALPVQAIPTPFATWSSACLGIGGGEGLALGWHVLIAGASGGAKTFTAINLACHAVKQGERVAIYSLEMDHTEIAARYLPMLSGVDAYRIAPGKHFSRDHFERARERVDLARGTLSTNAEPLRSMDEILDAMHAQAEAGCRLHIIDYLQLAWVRDARTIFDRISEVSHEVRALAKARKVVTVGLSQLNRAGNTTEAPRKEAMSGSSSLENDADQVLLLDHSRRRDVSNEEGRPLGWFGWLTLAKNRHGPAADIPVAFNRDTFAMRERDPDEIDPEEVKR
jgi:replicative DNA helicase